MYLDISFSNHPKKAMLFPGIFKLNDFVVIIYFLFLLSCQAKVHELAGDDFRYSVLDPIKRWIQVSHAELVLNLADTGLPLHYYMMLKFIRSPFRVLYHIPFLCIMYSNQGWTQEIHVEMLLLHFSLFVLGSRRYWSPLL